MPHGAGHVGGHHHHHHHHGGFHHHHHHQYGHHHSRGWYWGGPVYHRYGYGYRRRGISCMVAVILIVVVVIPLSVALGLRYGAVSADVDSSNQYALTDKVLRDYSNVFCQGLSAQSMNSRDLSNATLYMLSSSPPLSDIERFNLSDSVLLSSEGEYKQWNFYLNRGSTVSLKMCYTSSDSTLYTIDFNLIRSDKNFNRWLNDEASSSYSIKHHSLTTQCQTVTYSVSTNDRFYFTFYSDNYLSADLNIDFQFKRTVYHVDPSNVVEYCTIPLDWYSSCSVDIPLSASYTALLSLNTSPPVDYGDEGKVYIDCQPRIWIYAVIAVSVVIAAVAILTCCIVCVCVLVKRNKKKYTPLQGGGDDTAAREVYEDGANPPVVNVTAGDATGIPPPYNPQYPTAAGGGYGATTTAPGSTQYTHVYAQ